jgi:flavin reductase (DIM6/NTAB) family NADH-FMN oxidoreductase RutF
MTALHEEIIRLPLDQAIWERFFTVAPLVVIGTKEGKHYDMAPKHMAMPLGSGPYFGFVCTPRHATYHNVKREHGFTVSFPRPDQVTLASLAASPRCEEGDHEKGILQHLPTIRAERLDALFLKDSYLFLTCTYLKTIDGFDKHSLICGKIIDVGINKNYLRISEQDEQEMIAEAPLLAYLAYGRFAEIKESRAFPFPKDFKN